MYKVMRIRQANDHVFRIIGRFVSEFIEFSQLRLDDSTLALQNWTAKPARDPRLAKLEKGTT